MATLPRGAAEGADSDQLLVEAHGSVRTMILNRPKQLNALSSAMIRGLLRCFTAYEKDDGVKLLIIKGNRKAFCAGGDVAECAAYVQNDNWKWGADFFRNEYLLNYTIATYIKSQVSILSGIVMGGGAGVSIHGRFRVATNNTGSTNFLDVMIQFDICLFEFLTNVDPTEILTFIVGMSVIREQQVFAMPETALGLFPDIGASYFLSRLPGFYGEYIALTGARLDGAEMLACGLATHFVQSDMLVLLEESLKMLDTSNSSVVCGIIDQFSQQPSLKDNSSLNRIEIINKCFCKRTVEGIIYALEQEASNLADEWVAATIKSLKRASPTSLKISLRSIREGRTQTIGECLRREYRMVCHVLRGDFSRDLSEGYRAILLDKDNNPKWMPARLEQVPDEVVEQYFSGIDDPEWEDLNLPLIHSYRRNIKSKI